MGGWIGLMVGGPGGMIAGAQLGASVGTWVGGFIGAAFGWAFAKAFLKHVLGVGNDKKQEAKQPDGNDDGGSGGGGSGGKWERFRCGMCNEHKFVWPDEPGIGDCADCQPPLAPGYTRADRVYVEEAIRHFEEKEAAGKKDGSKKTETQ